MLNGLFFGIKEAVALIEAYQISQITPTLKIRHRICELLY